VSKFNANQKGKPSGMGIRIRQALHRSGASRSRNADRRGTRHSRYFATGWAVNILDLACEYLAHTLSMGRAGHHITAVDISETFIAEAREAACRARCPLICGWRISRRWNSSEQFDVITWIEKPQFSRLICRRHHIAFGPGADIS